MGTDAKGANGTAAEPQIKRGEGGRFVKGTCGGTGNPHAKRTHELRRVALETVTDDDMRRVFRGLIENAALGDSVAARVLLEYVLGKPKQSVEITGDGDPLDTRKWYGDAKTSAAELIAELHGKPQSDG